MCGGTGADAQVLQKAEVKQLLNRRQQVKAAQKAEIPVIFPVTSLFPGGAEIQDMKQLKSDRGFSGKIRRCNCKSGIRRMVRMGRETVLKHLGRQLSRSDVDQLELDRPLF